MSVTGSYGPAVALPAGLDLAVGWLKPIKEKYPNVSWADLMQLASATSIEVRPRPSLQRARLLIHQPLPLRDDVLADCSR